MESVDRAAGVEIKRELGRATVGMIKGRTIQSSKDEISRGTSRQNAGGPSSERRRSMNRAKLV